MKKQLAATVCFYLLIDYMKNIYKYLLFLLTALLVVSCSEEEHPWDNLNPPGGNTGGSTGGSTSNSANTQITSRMETPRVLNDGTTLLISHDVSINGKR